MSPDMNSQTVIDGLGHGVLILDDDGNLITSNRTVRDIISERDLQTIKDMGWDALVTLLSARQTDPENTLEAVRQRTTGDTPSRFQAYLSGEYVPCWLSRITLPENKPGWMVTLDRPDWSFITQTISTFRDEMDDAIRSTQGHIDIINKTIKHNDPDSDVDALARRINGFTRLISVHMYRVGRLIQMLDRMEDIRTGTVKTKALARAREVPLLDFFEDFEEELDEIMLVDPETEASDHRSRVTITGAEGVSVSASTFYLTRILHDMLRNAIMYSMKATPIKITVTRKEQVVQIDMIDQGYGVRDKEQERVFDVFKRARQPQIISEFGYGLSLFLCKHEVEAMNGTMWFESTEGVGTTFSLRLPIWEDVASSSSSDSET